MSVTYTTAHFWGKVLQITKSKRSEEIILFQGEGIKAKVRLPKDQHVRVGQEMNMQLSYHYHDEEQ